MGKAISSSFIVALVAVVLGIGLLAAGCGPAQEQPAAKPKEEAAKPASDVKPSLLSIIPNAPPRPTPTPLPPGAQPPPQPAPPAPKTVSLYAHIDTVTAGAGESKYNVDASLSCVKSSLFSRGMHIVWRMELVDVAGGGKILQAADVDKAVLKLPHGEEVNFRFGRHGATEDAPWFWTAAWDVPMDYPLGVLDYKVEVTLKGGRSVTVTDPLVVSAPERRMDTRPIIVPVTGA